MNAASRVGMYFRRFAVATALFLAAGAVAAFAGDGARPGGWRLGIGVSEDETDPGKAGEAAAAEARRRFGDGDAAVVLVMAASKQVVPGLIDGIAKHWPRERIYGGQVGAPITPTTNFFATDALEIDHGVAVLAVGGEVGVVVHSEPTAALAGDEAIIQGFAEVPGLGLPDQPYRVAGVRLARRFLADLENCEKPGKLLFVQGDQPNGPNRSFAVGLRETLGEGVAIIGGASGNQDAKEIVAGEVVQGRNYAVLFCGDFDIGVALSGGVHAPATADKVLGEAIAQGGGREPIMAFMYNCRRRRNGMIANKGRGEGLDKELEVMRTRMKGAPFFGAYGPGEIGSRGPGKLPEGAGFSVTAAVLFPIAAAAPAEE